jgi:uncharacterized OsmC-like protein
MNAPTKISPAGAVNGVPVDDVKALIAAVSADPAAAITRWRVANSWQGRFRSRGQVDGVEIGGQAVSRRFAVEIDEPLELGGTDLHANPQEYLLAALNACIIVGFTALCALHGVEIETLEVVTEGDIDLRGFFGLDASVSPGYDSLETRATVKGSASPQEFQRIFDMALATSPNLHNIRRPIKVAPKLVVA